MNCKMLILPLWAGLTLNARTATAKTFPEINKTNPAISVFVENTGQITDQSFHKRADIDFKLSGDKNCTVFIGSGKIHYQWVAATEDKGTGTIHMYRMDVSLVGASSNATISTEAPQSYYERYYTNSCNGRVAPSYKKITYKNIYPNIDWTLYVTDKKIFKYDFIVHPGGKISDLQLQYGGATTLTLQQDGSLRAITPVGSIDEHAPVCYTQEGRAVGSRYLLKGNVISFGIDSYNGTLVIDPAIQWSTYLGGLGNDQPSALAADTSGNVFMGGGTLSLGNIATAGSYQYSYGGTGNGSYIMGDAFVSKFDGAGNCLWSTYYGGSLEDRGLDIAFDKTSGSIYLAGSTKSTSGIATTGAHQSTIGGNFDAFLVKFDSTGQRIWGTYYGGSSTEGNSYNTIGTTCDKDGNIFLCGESNSNNNIASAGCYQPVKSTSNDAFIVKFNSNGSSRQKHSSPSLSQNRT